MLGGVADNLRKGLPAFIVAAGAIGLALVWLDVDEIIAIAAVLGGIIVGTIAYLGGRVSLYGQHPHPLSALKWFWWSMLLLGSLAAAAGAALILLGIEWAPQDDWSQQKKGVLAAVTAAVTTYLTAALIKGADEADDGWVGAITKAEFRRAFKDKFETSTEAEQAVYSESRFSGWGRSARKERAEAIERALYSRGPAGGPTGWR
jgi:hypothetical protein